MTETYRGLVVHAFADGAALESWLAAQPTDAPGIWLKLAKQNVNGIRRAAAVDAVLCHGWIDGQPAKYNDSHWLLRLTPRRARSKWSEINRTRVQELITAGRVGPNGLAQVEAARADGRWDAAYAPASTAAVPPDLQAALDANLEAATFFATLTGANRYAVLYRITTVKKAETRARKIAEFVVMLARGETIYPAPTK